MRARLLLNEFCNFDGASCGKALAMELDAFDFVQGFCRKITLSTIRAAYHRDVLNNQQIFSFAMCFSYSAKARPYSTANIANELRLFIFFHGIYTVKIKIKTPIIECVSGRMK